jgi:hypothetical protein
LSALVDLYFSFYEIFVWVLYYLFSFNSFLKSVLIFIVVMNYIEKYTKSVEKCF